MIQEIELNTHTCCTLCHTRHFEVKCPKCGNTEREIGVFETIRIEKKFLWWRWTRTESVRYKHRYEVAPGQSPYDALTGGDF